jgi:hypothetical protein
MNIKNYFQLSDNAAQVTDLFLDPREFLERFHLLPKYEQESYIRHFTICNLPYIFKEKPLLFERIKEYLSRELSVDSSEVILIGSAKTGFSVSENNYGRPFSPESDFDFSVINESLFEKLVLDFQSWARDYDSNIIIPKHDKEKIYWDDNRVQVKKNIENSHFIDTYKIPSKSKYLTTQHVNNTLYKIGFHLKRLRILSKEKVSLRVYRDWRSFSERLIFNNKYVLNKVINKTK